MNPVILFVLIICLCSCEQYHLIDYGIESSKLTRFM